MSTLKRKKCFIHVPNQQTFIPFRTLSWLLIFMRISFEQNVCACDLDRCFNFLIDKPLYIFMLSSAIFEESKYVFLPLPQPASKIAEYALQIVLLTIKQVK